MLEVILTENIHNFFQVTFVQRELIVPRVVHHPHCVRQAIIWIVPVMMTSVIVYSVHRECIVMEVETMCLMVCVVPVGTAQVGKILTCLLDITVLLAITA